MRNDKYDGEEPLDTVTLPGFPSCSGCLSWSADGELAVAAGEFVHILTPKSDKTHLEDSSCRPAASSWHVSRIRANSFTKTEWPYVDAQDRASFSIGREQSVSHVIGLSWSPPGLAKHRRCLLSVLTANLLLSLYEGISPGKWTRVAIVNHSLRSHFSVFVHEESSMLRKASVRSFSWFPPLKNLASDNNTAPYHVPGPEYRWGFYFLAIANDDNDIICLRALPLDTDPRRSDRYLLDIMSCTSLGNLTGSYPRCQPISLLSAIMRSSARSMSTSCGPWLPDEVRENGAYTAASLVGVVCGAKLKVVRFLISLIRPGDLVEGSQMYNIVTNSAELVIPGSVPDLHFTGPTQWIFNRMLQNIYLAVGGIAGLAVISVPPDIYIGRAKPQEDSFGVQEVPFYVSNDMQEQQRHWEPIGAMIVTLDDTHSPTLHMGTIGGHTLVKSFPCQSSKSSVSPTPWQRCFDELRDGFDINCDLGGLAVGRIWGLASHRELIASATTLHPGDMIDYRSAVAESINIIISPVHRDEAGFRTRRKTPLQRSPEALRANREFVIGFILHAVQGKESNDMYNRIAYAAACCTIVESENEPLRQFAGETLRSLAAATGADLRDEISKCAAAPSHIEPKMLEQLDARGGQLYEKCEICDSGIAWYSAHESECASGHLFVRCSLSFLSIQEPGISKICSGCRREYLRESYMGISQHQHLYGILSAAFDVCIYCDSKFRD